MPEDRATRFYVALALSVAWLALARTHRHHDFFYYVDLSLAIFWMCLAVVEVLSRLISPRTER